MGFDKTNPFLATIAEREVLNKHGSAKCTVHVSLDISGSHLEYKVGDSIAVYPENSQLIVKEILRILKVEDPLVLVTDSRTEQSIPLESFLLKKANLTKVTKKWIQFICDHSTDPKQKKQLEHFLAPEQKEELKYFCDLRQLWDFLKDFSSFKVDLQEFVNMFAPLLPRFYSIASSQKKSPHRIDLLIAYFKYQSNDHLRHGVASHYLCEMAQMHTPCVPIYLHPSRGFALPEDLSQPIIMIGPGTGVAPFRAFMQERIATHAKGKNWLFFGDWNKEYDFYYQDYWENLAHTGHLKLSTAFSRDQSEKIYVQHQMQYHAKELWQWIQQKAIIYVCGDALRMARDVDAMLHQIIQEQGQMSVEEAAHYVKAMRENNLYLRDIY